MPLEFIQDSPELQNFVQNLSFVTTAHEIDENEAVQVYRHLDGKYYSVLTGYRGRFCAHRKDWKKENPYVVKFTQVLPEKQVITVIKWRQVENGERL